MNYLKIISKNIIIIRIRKNKKRYFNELLLFEMFLVFNLIANIISLNQYQYSEINITIKGNGTQRILNNKSVECGSSSKLFDSIPDQIFVNDELQNYTGFSVYNLKNDINNISIRWNYSITNCNSMFGGLSNIIDIDLSNFDASEVLDMTCMFRDCTSLTSINFKNINTLNLNNMDGMFYECNALISLNLNSFDTSLVTKMLHLFFGCTKLNKLNMYNFNFSSVKEKDDMFYNVNDLIYCIKPGMESPIRDQFPTSSKNNCSEICFENNYYYCYKDSCPENYNKFISEKKICINSCINDDYYKYEYNNSCYYKCPLNTAANNNSYICEDLKNDYSTSIYYDNIITDLIT